MINNLSSSKVKTTKNKDKLIKLLNETGYDTDFLIKGSNTFLFLDGKFTRDTIRFMTSSFGDKNIEVFPGIYQNSDKYRDFKFDVYKTCCERLQDVNDGSYQGAECLLVDWSQPCSMLMGPLIDNRSYRKEIGCVQPSKQYIDNYVLFLTRLLKKGEFQQVTLKKESQSGYPDCVSGSEYKATIIKNLIEKGDLFFNTFINKGPYNKSLLDLFRYMPMYIMNTRYQSERVLVDETSRKVEPKKRMYGNKEYILSSGAFGSLQNPDYTVYSKDGDVDERFICCRARQIFGQNYTSTFITQLIGGFITKSYKSDETFISKDSSYQLAWIKKFTAKHPRASILCLDFSNYGETHVGELNYALFTALKNVGFSSHCIDVIKADFEAPVYTKSLYKNEYDPFFDRSLHDKVSGFQTIKSGHALISCFNYLAANFYIRYILTICTLKLHKRNVRDEDMLFSWLNDRRYEDFYDFKTGGDDNIILCSSEESRKALVETLVDPSYKIYNTSVEKYNIFLGSYYTTTSTYRNISKMLESLLCSERSYKRKSFHALGVACKRKMYEDNPQFFEVDNIIQEMLLKYYDFDYKKYYEPYQTVTGEINMEFLTKPETLQYKYSNSDIALSLIELFYDFFSVEEIEKFMQDNDLYRKVA